MNSSLPTSALPSTSTSADPKYPLYSIQSLTLDLSGGAKPLDQLLDHVRQNRVLRVRLVQSDDRLRRCVNERPRGAALLVQLEATSTHHRGHLIPGEIGR